MSVDNPMDNAPFSPFVPCSPYWVSPIDALILGILLAEKGIIKLDGDTLREQLDRQTKAFEDMRNRIDAQQAILDMPKEQKEQWMLKETLSTLNVCRPHNDPEKE